MRRKLLSLAIVIICLITPLAWWHMSIIALADTFTQIFLPLVVRESRVSVDSRLLPEAQKSQPLLERRINGYPVPESVYAFYEQVGSAVTGIALSEYRFNPNLNRYEMYFDNLAIYVHANDPAETVHLMQLGSWLLHAAVDTPPQPASIPIAPRAIEAMDRAAVQAGIELTGQELIPLTRDETGSAIRIYEHVAMRVENQDYNTVIWLPLPKLLGIQPHPPTRAINDPRYYFLPVEGELGHNVPQGFLEFILNHGGLEISGRPITEIFYADQARTIIRQCFDHLCLDYHTTSASIKPASLGIDYSRRFEKQPIPSVQAISALHMNVWEARPALPADQPQRITVRISQNDLPVINLRPLLEISLPNGEILAYNMPATDHDGLSSQQVPAVDAPNGSIIAYQICILHMDASRYCVQDSYLIWNIP